MTRDARPIPPWKQTSVPRGTPAPTGRFHAQVVVVGAGLAGISTALSLQESGLSVLLVDRRGAGEGETGSTTSHCTQFMDVRYRELVRSRGEGPARQVLALSHEALETLETRARQHAAGSFGRVPGLLLTEQKKEVEGLQEELETLRGLGAQGVHWEQEALPWRQAVGAVRWEQQGWLEPRSYLAGLLRAFLAAGGRFYEGVEVRRVHDGTPCHLEARDLELLADRVVLATHEAPFFLKLVPKLPAYRTYAIGLRALPDFPRSLAYDTEDPYHYVRTHPWRAGQMAIIGGEDHKVGHDEDPEPRWERLEAWARERLPVGARIARWSGQILEPVDELPFIGALGRSGRISIATGFSGSGMIWGTVAARVLTAQLLAGDHPATSLLDPRRIDPRRQWMSMLGENLDFPKQLVLDRLQRPPSPRDAPLAPGEGRVVKVEGEEVAMARDLEGRLHAVSALCTHMACRVAFNDAEKSWDCPCHGSRFSMDGAVLNGPATRPLRALGLEEDEEEQREAPPSPEAPLPGV